jgi:hypothetical protein
MREHQYPAFGQLELLFAGKAAHQEEEYGNNYKSDRNAQPEFHSLLLIYILRLIYDLNSLVFWVLNGLCHIFLLLFVTKIEKQQYNLFTAPCSLAL